MKNLKEVNKDVNALERKISSLEEVIGFLVARYHDLIVKVKELEKPKRKKVKDA